MRDNWTWYDNVAGHPVEEEEQEDTTEADLDWGDEIAEERMLSQGDEDGQ